MGQLYGPTGRPSGVTDGPVDGIYSWLMGLRVAHGTSFGISSWQCLPMGHPWVSCWYKELTRWSPMGGRL